MHTLLYIFPQNSSAPQTVGHKLHPSNLETNVCESEGKDHHRKGHDFQSVSRGVVLPFL
jgi:hypothetical protein